MTETTLEKIARLNEAHGLLFDSMLKYGCYTRCHGKLFDRIRQQKEALGVFEEPIDP